MRPASRGWRRVVAVHASRWRPWARRRSPGPRRNPRRRNTRANLPGSVAAAPVVDAGTSHCSMGGASSGQTEGAPALSPGPTRSSPPRACNARSPPASPTVARAGSAPPASWLAVPGGLRLGPRPHPEPAGHRALGALDIVTAKENVVLLGPPGTGNPTWPRRRGPRPPGRHRVLFAPHGGGFPGSPARTTTGDCRTSCAASARCWASLNAAVEPATVADAVTPGDGQIT